MAHAGQTIKPLVQLGKSPEQCWEWLGPKTAGGYGKKTYCGRDLLAHRWIWEQLFGPIPAGLVVHHACNNPGCVNPSHLIACTQAENCRESITSTLVPGDVFEIRQAKKTATPGTRQRLADKFGVSPQLITDIWHGRAWTKPKPFIGPKNPRNQFSAVPDYAAQRIESWIEKNAGTKEPV